MSWLADLPEATLRSHTSIKWSRAAAGVIPADIAELDFAVPEPVRAVVRRAAEVSDFGYPDYSTGTPVQLADVFCQRAAEQFGWHPDPGRIEICAQVMQGLCGAILAYTEPGDRVLTHSPTYAPIVSAIEQLGRSCEMIPVTADPESTAAPVPLIVLCNPHNPTGLAFSRRRLNSLAEFADRAGAVVLRRRGRRQPGGPHGDLHLGG